MYLTHWGRDKMAAISQTILSNAFSYEFRLKFLWSLFLKVKLTVFHHWFRQWLGAGQATSHYLNQWWLVYWRIYASLGLNELKIWGLRYGSSPWHWCPAHSQVFVEVLVTFINSLPKGSSGRWRIYPLIIVWVNIAWYCVHHNNKCHCMTFLCWHNLKF